MNGFNLDGYQESEADVDLRRCPASQASALLDLVQFDRFLDYIYTVLMKREPDREGRRHYRELAARGVPRPIIVRSLLRSREHRASSVEAAGLTAEEFVTRAYRDILGRSPDQDGLQTYARIAAKPNGRRKVLANLGASDEAVRKNGGRLARIEGLRRFAREGWPARLPVVGPWFTRLYNHSRRLDRLALNQYLLARQVASLREELEEGAEPFGFIDDAPGNTPATDGGRSAAIFRNALTRARREI